MNDTHQLRGDSGLLFSPQAFPPGLLGQRRVESTLFDVRQIDVARRLARYRQPEPSNVQAGSGLIDIATLVGVTRGGDARPVVVPPPHRLVAHLDPAPAPAADDRAARRLLAMICALLVAAIAMLAIEALR